VKFAAIASLPMEGKRYHAYFVFRDGLLYIKKIFAVQFSSETSAFVLPPKPIQKALVLLLNRLRKAQTGQKGSCYYV
jgi:hypothetical protein